ncbi:MAG: hypothetical protein U0794_14870 [Isosphaeraceae bacterium]
MVRPRSVVIPMGWNGLRRPVIGAASTCVMALLVSTAVGQETAAPAPSPPAKKATTTPAPAPAPTPTVAESKVNPSEPIDRLPYRIRVLLATDPDARLDARRRDALLEEWQTLVRRFVGAPWRLEILSEARAELLVMGGELEVLEPPAVASYAEEADKVWLIRVSGAGSGLAFRGREFDVATRRLGPIQRRVAAVSRDAARVFLGFALDLFAPYAVIGERFGKDVNLVVRGGSLEPASPLGRVVVPGAVFQPFRVVPRKNEPPIVRDIPYTFLRVEAAEPPGARCSFVSVYSDPFTNRVVQKTSLVALGIKPGQSPTRLRFVTLPDRAPAAGYVFTARTLPDGQPRELGLTDREGRITLPPGIAEGLVVGRLLAGSEEPMIEFPLVPGESEAERLIPAFDPKPQTVTLEARLDSIRDAVIDLVAIRARLLSRLKARFDGEDWAGAAAVLKEHAQLPPRDSFATELNRLKDEAARQQAQTKKAILTKTAQARIAELQALIERYLDDEEFLGYSDALSKLTTESRGKPSTPAKPQARPSSAPSPPAVPPSPAPPREAPAQPSNPAPAPNAPSPVTPTSGPPRAGSSGR